MTFWLTVGLCYLGLLALGTALGIIIGSRRRGGGGGEAAPDVPEPLGPTLALECPPLGSDFDRSLLPGVTFADEQIPV